MKIMSKRLFAVLLVFSFTIPMMLMACVSEVNPPDTEIFEFTLHHQDPPTAAMGEFFEAYAQRLYDESEGRIRITIYANATLGNPLRSYTLVTTGICDLAWGQVALFPGQFPMTEAISLPMIGIENAYMGGRILWDMFNETDLLSNEYKHVQVLFLQTNMDAPLGTNIKVSSSDDLSELNIRSPGGPVNQFIAKLGANPKSIPITELYSSLENNNVDGFISDWHGIDGFALVELAKYYLDEKIQVMPFWFVMNKDKWASLPQDIQQIFLDNSGDAALLEIEQYYNSRLQRVTNNITTAGGEIYELSSQERTLWKNYAEETWTDWVNKYQGRGIDVLPALQEVNKRVQNFSNVIQN